MQPIIEIIQLNKDARPRDNVYVNADNCLLVEVREKYATENISFFRFQQKKKCI